MYENEQGLSYPWSILAVEIAVWLHKELNGDGDDVISIYGYLTEAEPIAQWCSTRYKEILGVDELSAECARIFSKYFDEEYEAKEFLQTSDRILKRLSSQSFKDYLV